MVRPVFNLLKDLRCNTSLAETTVVTTTTDNGHAHGLIVGGIIWIFIGLIAGFLASKVVNKRGDGLILDIVLGLIGSVVGGLIMNLIGLGGDGNLIWSIAVATLGAIIVLVIYHNLIGGSKTA